MNENIRTPQAAQTVPPTSPSAASSLLWFAVPLLALVVATLWLINSDWLKAFDTGAPPVEKLTFERTVLDNDGIHLQVRAGGSDELTIAQVMVDDAYWAFKQDPAGALSPLSSTWLHIPYPWVLGEKHEVKVLTRPGTVFKHEIAVAVPTPQAQIGHFGPQALLGTFVGIVPVIIGMLFYPALRGVGRHGLNFVLALTIGLLAYLFVDSLKEAIEFGIKSAHSFQGIPMVVLAATAAFLLLYAVGRRHGTPTGLALATFIALGIGLHNFGEGLAIGAAFTAGVAGLGVFLVLGFTLHNVTEGIGIVAPLVDEQPTLPAFLGLALLAGAPAILGIWLGSLSYAPHWAALALAIGAGAILQVIVEVGGYLKRRAGPDEAWFTPSTLAGLTLGIAIMYVTAIFVKV
jgi:zinc transporter, ZIP family